MAEIAWKVTDDSVTVDGLARCISIDWSDADAVFLHDQLNVPLDASDEDVLARIDARALELSAGRQRAQQHESRLVGREGSSAEAGRRQAKGGRT